MTTTFQMVKLTGVTVNMKKNEIHISAVVQLTDDNFESAESLKPYLDAELGGVTMVIEPQQKQLMEK